MRGHLIETDAIVLRKRTGGIRMGDIVYEVGTTPDGSPIVTNHSTGHHWRITWETLVRLAREEGIDDPAPAPEGGPADAA